MNYAGQEAGAGGPPLPARILKIPPPYKPEGRQTLAHGVSRGNGLPSSS